MCINMSHQMNTVASLSSTLTQPVVSPNFFRSPMTFYESTLKLRSTRNVFVFPQFFQQLKMYLLIALLTGHILNICVTMSSYRSTSQLLLPLGYLKSIKIINEKSIPEHTNI